MPNLFDALSEAFPGVAARTATALGRSYVGTVTIRTQFSPPVVVEPFADVTGERPAEVPPNPILALVKPEIVVRAPDGSTSLVIAPYGTPTENHLPWLLAGLAVLALGAVAAVGYVARRV